MADCIVYFSVFGLVFLLNAFAIRRYRSFVGKVLIALGFVILLCFIGFRYNVGTDYDNYLGIYNSITNTSWENLFSMNIEPAVAVMFKALSFVLWDAKLVFVVIGFLLLWPVYKANKLYDYKYLAYSVFCFCILFLPFGLNGMRQGMSMSFALLALSYFNKDKTKNSIICFVISCLLHTSALFLVPYALGAVFTKKRKKYILPINAILTIVLSIVVVFFLSSLLQENGIVKYDYILKTMDIENASLIGLIIYSPIIIANIASVWAGYKKQRPDNQFVLYGSLSLSGLVFYIIGSSAKYLSRLGLTLMIPSIITIPYLLQETTQRKHERVLLKALFVVYLVLFFVIHFYIWGKHEIMPYQTWLVGGV